MLCAASYHSAVSVNSYSKYSVRNTESAS